MAAYDLFNGDSAGIYALIQLRLAAPSEIARIIHIKRGNKLLAKIDVQAVDKITVLNSRLKAWAAVPIFGGDREGVEGFGGLTSQERVDFYLRISKITVK